MYLVTWVDCTYLPNSPGFVRTCACCDPMGPRRPQDVGSQACLGVLLMPHSVALATVSDLAISTSPFQWYATGVLRCRLLLQTQLGLGGKEVEFKGGGVRTDLLDSHNGHGQPSGHRTLCSPSSQCIVTARSWLTVRVQCRSLWHGIWHQVVSATAQ